MPRPQIFFSKILKDSRGRAVVLKAASLGDGGLEDYSSASIVAWSAVIGNYHTQLNTGSSRFLQASSVKGHSVIEVNGFIAVL